MRILQVVVSTLGMALACHRRLNTPSLAAEHWWLSNIEYADLTENVPFWSPFHRSWSRESLHKAPVLSLDNMSTSISVSQWNLSLLQFKFHCQLFFSHTPTSPTLLPWSSDKENSLGYTDLRHSFPSHRSSQNLTMALFPTFHPMAFWNQPSSTPSPQILVRSFHHHDWYFDLSCIFSATVPYLDEKISFHFPHSLLMSLHLHFARRATLKFFISFTPMPPNSKGLHTLSQLTQDIDLLALFSPSP